MPLPTPAALKVTSVRLTYLAFIWGAAYFTSWLLLRDAMLPGGAGWALVLIYVCATAAGKLVPLVSKRLPPLLGMLLSGLLLRNIPGGAVATTVPLLGEEFAWWSRWLRKTEQRGPRRSSSQKLRAEACDSTHIDRR